MEEFMLPYEYDRQMESSKWQKEIPFIQFPSDWQVKITPPFAGAVVRFRIKKGDAEISIYLDCYDKLGCYGSPYWEVYPHDDDVYRCDMNATNELLEAITYAIKNWRA